MHYTCIACITIDYVMTNVKILFRTQVYFEECKYKIKKIKMSEFIKAKLETDSGYDSE